MTEPWCWYAKEGGITPSGERCKDVDVCAPSHVDCACCECDLCAPVRPKGRLDYAILRLDGEGEMTLREAIAQIPGDDGWFESSGEEAFCKAANMMLEGGSTPKKIIGVLNDMYGAGAECFASMLEKMVREWAARRQR